MTTEDEKFKKLLRARAEASYPSVEIGPEPLVLLLPTRVDAVSHGPIPGQVTFMPVPITTAAMQRLAEILYLDKQHDQQRTAITWPVVEQDRETVVASQQDGAIIPRLEYPMRIHAQTWGNLIYWEGVGKAGQPSPLPPSSPELGDLEEYDDLRWLHTTSMTWGTLYSTVVNALNLGFREVKLFQQAADQFLIQHFVSVPLEVELTLPESVRKSQDFDPWADGHTLHTAPVDLYDLGDVTQLMVSDTEGEPICEGGPDAELVIRFRAPGAVVTGVGLRVQTHQETLQDVQCTIAQIETAWLQKGAKADPRVDIPVKVKTSIRPGPARGDAFSPMCGSTLLH